MVIETGALRDPQNAEQVLGADSPVSCLYS